MPDWAAVKREGVLHQALKNTKHLLTEDKQDTNGAVPSQQAPAQKIHHKMLEIKDRPSISQSNDPGPAASILICCHTPNSLVPEDKFIGIYSSLSYTHIPTTLLMLIPSSAVAETFGTTQFHFLAEAQTGSKGKMGIQQPLSSPILFHL